MPWRLDAEPGPLSFFTTMSTFATPNDVTVADLAVELFLPADPGTERAMRVITNRAAAAPERCPAERSRGRTRVRSVSRPPGSGRR